MIVNTLTEVKDFLQAQFCYHFFITPLPFPLEKEYRDFAERACEFVASRRTELIQRNKPRHHVIHRFEQPGNPQAKKVLITHGWMSRAAYMVKLIRALHQEGYDVYALDFPAHGEARGWQLTWLDAVTIINSTLNELGPFYAVLGHSFGGSMLLNTLNLAHQLPEWELQHMPDKAVMIASPTQMRTPVSKLARRMGLNGSAFLQLRNVIRQNSKTNIAHLNFRKMINTCEIPILCIHGNEDDSVSPNESIVFCRRYPHASLSLLPGVDHVGVLIDSRVETRIIQYLDIG
ncbi:putative hydrolase [Legionella birminghamensis]|uniref:Hydrolase n=1 Tax=Legionella birminghamensis TaxID=28083 RepID=A0A378IEJ7_9GAMM|nr:alpha/beta fold hydrolase [Legionella birminghamensis]KTC66791.1 putative hydrolase [Legionella birminghamensis]STX32941.1 putative hydrolase [Legionella birminghamensis]